jgi:hypothetical protein
MFTNLEPCIIKHLKTGIHKIDKQDAGEIAGPPHNKMLV